MVGHAEAGRVDGTGPTVRFNKPVRLTIDDQGQMMVAECANDSVRVVEASLLPPARLTATETASEKALRTLQTDYRTLRGRTALRRRHSGLRDHH